MQRFLIVIFIIFIFGCVGHLPKLPELPLREEDRFLDDLIHGWGVINEVEHIDIGCNIMPVMHILGSKTGTKFRRNCDTYDLEIPSVIQVRDKVVFRQL